jgi:hypothetical protein
MANAEVALSAVAARSALVLARESTRESRDLVRIKAQADGALCLYVGERREATTL